MSSQHLPRDKSGKLDLRPCGHSGNQVTRTLREQRDEKPELTFSMVDQGLFNHVIECLISVLEELDDEDQKYSQKNDTAWCRSLNQPQPVNGNLIEGDFF